MKIVCEFESYKEFLDFINGEAEAELIKTVTEQTSAAAPKKEEKKPAPEKTDKAKPEKKPEPVKEEPTAGDWTPGGGNADDSIVNPTTGRKYEEEDAEQRASEKPAPEEEAPVDESFRVKVRKTLAALNKKTGKNTASELIHGFGVAKLTEVELKDLPALMQKAEEALNA
nr:MAG TPA: hypothetical protein [Caudoviricetes sp.]